jgi:1-acyl-sn-glycerol-3-phosphate acyltransferase
MSFSCLALDQESSHVAIPRSGSYCPGFLADSPRILSFVTTHQHYNLSAISRWILQFAGCVPIERGGHDPVGVRRMLRCLQAGHILCVFPEGNLSGVGLGRMRRWKYGAAYLALKSGVPVYPVWIEGGPRTDRLVRAWLGRSGRFVQVHYGAAVDLAAYRGRKITRARLEEVAELLLKRVRETEKSGAGRGHANVAHKAPETSWERET